MAKTDSLERHISGSPLTRERYLGMDNKPRRQVNQMRRRLYQPLPRQRIIMTPCSKQVPQNILLIFHSASLKPFHSESGFPSSHGVTPNPCQDTASIATSTNITLIHRPHRSVGTIPHLHHSKITGRRKGLHVRSKTRTQYLVIKCKNMGGGSNNPRCTYRTLAEYTPLQTLTGTSMGTSGLGPLRGFLDC